MSAAAKTINFTKSTLTALPVPAKGFVTYRDEKEKGLSAYITAKGVVSFFVRKRINQRDERVGLGTFPTITVENARKLAQQAKGEIAGGKNPNAQKHKLRQEITFGDMFKTYMERHSKKHKRSWKYDEREVNKFLGGWFSRKISLITKQEIQALHERIGDENGQYQANRLLERIKAIYNKAIEWGWDGHNPAKGVKKFKEKSRDRFIQPDEMPRFLQAAEMEENEVARDYILLSLLTGARKTNVLEMRWEEINWVSCEWRIPQTKNGDAVTVALTERAMEILQRRRQRTNSEWVFPSDLSASGHLVEPRKAWLRVLKRAAISDLRLHDIRRTLGSYQALTGASLPVIGKSLGHKSQQATSIYA